MIGTAANLLGPVIKRFHPHFHGWMYIIIIAVQGGRTCYVRAWEWSKYMCLYHNFSEQIIKNAYPNKQYNHSEHASKDKVIMATGPGDGNIITISSQWLKEQMTQYISSLLQRRGQSVLARSGEHLCLDDAFIVCSHLFVHWTTICS